MEGKKDTKKARNTATEALAETKNHSGNRTEQADRTESDANIESAESVEALAKAINADKQSADESPKTKKVENEQDGGLLAQVADTPDTERESEAESNSETNNEKDNEIVFEIVRFPTLQSDRESVRNFLEALEKDLLDKDKTTKVKREFPELDVAALDFARGSILAKDSDESDCQEAVNTESVRWAINQLSKKQ